MNEAFDYLAFLLFCFAVLLGFVTGFYTGLVSIRAVDKYIKKIKKIK